MCRGKISSSTNKRHIMLGASSRLYSRVISNSAVLRERIERVARELAQDGQQQQDDHSFGENSMVDEDESDGDDSLEDVSSPLFSLPSSFKSTMEQSRQYPCDSSMASSRVFGSAMSSSVLVRNSQNYYHFPALYSSIMQGFPEVSEHSTYSSEGSLPQQQLKHLRQAREYKEDHGNSAPSRVAVCLKAFTHLLHWLLMLTAWAAIILLPLYYFEYETNQSTLLWTAISYSLMTVWTLYLSILPRCKVRQQRKIVVAPKPVLIVNGNGHHQKSSQLKVPARKVLLQHKLQETQAKIRSHQQEKVFCALWNMRKSNHWHENGLDETGLKVDKTALRQLLNEHNNTSVSSLLHLFRALLRPDSKILEYYRSNQPDSRHY